MASYGFATYGVKFEMIILLNRMLWLFMASLLGCIEFVIIPNVVYQFSAILG